MINLTESITLPIIFLLILSVCAIIALLSNITTRLGRIEKDMGHIKRMLFAIIRDFKGFKAQSGTKA